MLDDNYDAGYTAGGKTSQELLRRPVFSTELTEKQLMFAVIKYSPTDLKNEPGVIRIRVHPDFTITERFDDVGPRAHYTTQSHKRHYKQ